MSKNCRRIRVLGNTSNSDPDQVDSSLRSSARPVGLKQEAYLHLSEADLPALFAVRSAATCMRWEAYRESTRLTSQAQGGTESASNFVESLCNVPSSVLSIAAASRVKPGLNFLCPCRRNKPVQPFACGLYIDDNRLTCLMISDINSEIVAMGI